MPAPVVIVDVAPVPDAELATALVSACSDAMRSGRCELAHAGPPPKEAWAIAVVTWEADNRAQVRFETASPHPSATRLRSVEFRPEDELWERWRTVGFAVAMIADAVAASEPMPESSHKDERQKSAPAPVRAEPEPRRPRFRIGVGAAVGPALDDGTVRVGGGLQGSLQPFTAPVFGSLSFRYTVRPEDDRGLVMRWVTFSGGLGAFVVPSELEAQLAVRLEATARYLGVNITDPDTGRTEGTERWSVGPLLGIDAAWPAQTPIGGVLSAEGSCVSRPTAIDVKQRPVGNVPTCGWLALAGVEMRFR